MYDEKLKIRLFAHTKIKWAKKNKLGQNAWYKCLFIQFNF